MEAPKFTDLRGREVSLYREDNAVAVNTFQPAYGWPDGDPLEHGTYHEVYVGGDDLDRLIVDLTKLRDLIAENPSKEN